MGVVIVTSTQIEQLREAAVAAGDYKLVELCDRAQDGDEAALRECARLIEEAEADDG